MALAPGTLLTFISFSIAVLTNLNPGSDINGVPASATKPTFKPF